MEQGARVVVPAELAPEDGDLVGEVCVCVCVDLGPNASHTLTL